MKLFNVKFSGVAVIMARDEEEAIKHAKEMLTYNATVSNMLDFETSEVNSKDDLPSSWDMNCVPYYGTVPHGNDNSLSTIEEILHRDNQ